MHDGIAATTAGIYDGTVGVAYVAGGGGGAAYGAGVYTGAGAVTYTIADVDGAVTICPANNDVICCCAAARVLRRSLVTMIMVLMFLLSTYTFALLAICICAML